MIILKIAKKKAKKILKNFLNEHAMLRDVAEKGLDLTTRVIKIQKNIRRFHFLRHFQRVCLQLMIEGVMTEIVDEKREKEREKERERGRRES